jgi:hypothetical protein
VRRREFLRTALGSAAGLIFAPRALEAALAAPLAEVAGAHVFVSRPDLRPQVVKAVRRGAGRSDGYVFLAPLSGPGDRGAMIVDDTGAPVWFRSSGRIVALNVRAAIYRGKPVLTWWEGRTEHGLGDGTHLIVDDSYREIARLPAGKGRHSDLHEFVLTPHGTALVTAWEAVPTDLSGIGGLRNGVVIGGIVQELALPSGRVLFEWRSLDHVPISETYAGVSLHAPFDYFHVNSVELDSDGDLLVSARNTWAIYKIDRGSGDVVWRLGGKRSDFAMAPHASFAWQHDARHHDGHLVSLFDDGAAPPVEPRSRGLVLALDLKRMRATLQRAYVHSPSTLAHALGNMQLLPNGNVLVGWGTSPYVTEYTAGGRVVLDLKLAHGGQNYRALKLPWSGRPTDVPAIGVRQRQGTTFVFASWNGATDVATWQLSTGTVADALQQERVSPRTGFETAIPVSAGARFAAVTALAAGGDPLATSKTLHLP